VEHRRIRWGLAVIATAGLVALAASCYPDVPPGDDFSSRWARTMSGSTNEDEFDGIATADQSVYVTGKFEGSATLGGRTLTSAGAADIPFARFDDGGRPLWVQRFGGPGEDNLFDVDATAAGPVATGWFAGTVSFGAVTLTSAGPSDCVVVALRPDGTTRWARAIGGPARDGCNEVTVGQDGSVTTSIDTQGGWTLPDGTALPSVPVAAADTVLVRLSAAGTPVWMRPVGGPGMQRGKSLAVAPDGSVAFGGDTAGPLTIAGSSESVPFPTSRDAWLSRWSPTGRLEWVHTWGGPGNDLAKGVADDGKTVTYAGPFTGTVTVGSSTLDAGTAADTLVAQRSTAGAVRWATSVSADTPLDGVEIVSAPDGGVLFGSQTAPGLHFGAARGPGRAVDASDGGTAWLAHYGADGSIRFARTIAGTAFGRVGELDRDGTRVYLDITLRGPDNEIDGTLLPTVGKDASVWMLDLASD
jgi:hypothetical protein